MSETKLVRDIQQQLSCGPVRLFRNNVGRLQDKNGTWVAYGLCPGSSDLIGWRSVVITREMVGQRVAVFTAIECKTPRGLKDSMRNLNQVSFIFTVRDSGGIGAYATTVEQARQVLNLDDNEVTLP